VTVGIRPLITHNVRLALGIALCIENTKGPIQLSCFPLVHMTDSFLRDLPSAIRSFECSPIHPCSPCVERLFLRNRKIQHRKRRNREIYSQQLRSLTQKTSHIVSVMCVTDVLNPGRKTVYPLALGAHGKSLIKNFLHFDLHAF